MADRPSIAAALGSVAGNATFVEGGLGAVKGVRCTGVSAGFRRNPERRDLALVVTDVPAQAAGVFTQNLFCAAPVTVSRAHLALTQATSGARAIVLNSGNANASTGEPGLQTAYRTAQIAAQHLGCEPCQVLVASTGVIGVPLAEDCFTTGIPLAISQLGSSDGTAVEAGLAAAHAIMTTDTYPKQAAVRFAATSAASTSSDEGATSGAGLGAAPNFSASYTIGGMVKGSGMIQPNMATLLGVFATDAPLTQEAASQALKLVMDQSYNKVTVDSDTSTNDSVFLLSTGVAGGAAIDIKTPAYAAFVEAFSVLCEDLARQIAYDGEGATKLVTVNVTGARSDADADLAGRAVANSPLVKTAIAGHDANWGRIAMAIGKSGAHFKQEDVDIAIMGLPVCERGLPVPFDEAEALQRFENYLEVVIDIDLKCGEGRARLWTCDLTHGYISINGDYRS